MDFGYLRIENDEVFITKEFLTKNFVKNTSLRVKMSQKNHRGSTKYIHFIDESTGKTWINYSSIPTNDLEEYGLPSKSQRLVEILCNAVEKSAGLFDVHLYFIFNIIWEGTGNWESYIPYYKPYYLNFESCCKLAKTHAIIQEIITLKRDKTYSLKTIYHTYMKMPFVTYKAGVNLSYFYRKIREFERGSIHEILMHEFKYKGREPYKITSSVQALIKRYYISKKRYNISMIHRLVNLELVSIGKSKISKSAVYKVCNTPDFKNKADFIRFGSKYAEERLIPYLKRKKVERTGALYEMDGKDLRIKCLKDDEIVNLWITLVLDVYSSKIVGYYLDTTENLLSVLTSLKMALEKEELIPEFILYDNNSIIRTTEYHNLKKRLLDYGCVLKECRAGNPKGKGHVENWFKRFNSNYLVFLKGFLGSGITAKSPGARANKDLERVYLSKSELKTFEVVKQEVIQKIKKYNSDINESTGMSPKVRFKDGKRDIKRTFKEHDIAYLFGKLKEVTVRRGMIIIIEKGIEYTYRIEHRFMVNKLNRTRVKVYFNSFHPYRIHVFNMENEYMTSPVLNVEINSIPRNNSDIVAMQYFHLKNIRDIKDNVVELLEEIKNGEELFRLETPIDILDNPTYKELEDLKMEDFNLMKKEFSISKPFGRSVNQAIENLSEEYLDYKTKENRVYKSIK